MINASLSFKISKLNYGRFKYSGERFEPKCSFIDRNRELIMELTPDRFKDIQITDFDTGFSDGGFYIAMEGELK